MKTPLKTPDPGAKAPRPKHVSSEDEHRPDMDHPPPASPATSTIFDQSTKAADREARTGTLPGPDDVSAERPERLGKTAAVPPAAGKAKK